MTSMQHPHQGNEGSTPARRARVATLIAASLGFGVIQLDVTVVNVAVRQIGVAFGGGVSELQWVISAYTLMFAALILSGGALGDRFGARRVFSLGFALFVLASMACGVAPTIGVLIAARGVQGLAAALLGSCSLALLSHTFRDGRERSRALGFWAAGASVALSGGPVIGGVLIATLGWRSIFFINLPIGLLGLWLTRRFAEETPRAQDRGLDPGGQVAAVTALAAFAAATIEAGPDGLTNRWVLAGYALFAVAATAFVARESRAARPMLPISLFRRSEVAGPTLIGLLVNVCFYGLIFIFSLLFQVQHGYSALMAGLAFVPMTGAILAANLGAAKVAGAVGAPRTIGIGVIAMGLGCAGLMWTGPGTPFSEIIVQQVLLGGGLGLLVPPMTGSLLQSVEPSRSGVASGTLNAMRQTGSLLGIALFGSLIVGRGQFYAGMHIALGISLAVLLVSGLLAGHLARTRPRPAGTGTATATDTATATGTARRDRSLAGRLLRQA
jgi:MFS transporter, DHA2 family, methylenomycin A resistance protein